MTIIIIILTLLLFLSGFFIYNLFNQVEQLEEQVQKIYKENEKNLNEFNFFYKMFLGWFTEAHLELNRVDKRGSFSSDDEIGFAFKVVKESMEQVKARLEALETPKG